MLEIKKLSKNFGEHLALDQIDLTIQSGEFFSLLGPSGCGKTTLLRILGGFEKSSSGQVLLDQQDILKMESYQRPVNTVFQSYALFPHLSVFENIAFGLRMKKTTESEIMERVSSMLELMQMQSFSLRMPETLSGGQKQRVALARALVNMPQILLLDESLSALDLKLRKEMQMELLQLQRKLQMTFVFVTHDQEEAMTLSDRIAVMKDGRIEQVGTPQQIYNQPKSVFVADFVGAVNKWSGSIKENDKFEIADGAITAHVSPQLKSPSGSRKAELVVRPEKIHIQSESFSNQEQLRNFNQFSVIIETVIFKGPVTDFLCSFEDHREIFLTVSSSAREDQKTVFQKNQKAFVCWSVEDSHIYVNSEL